MEALCYSLVRVRGLSPLDASNVIKDMISKEVSNFRVSIYVDRGKRKLEENDNASEVEEEEIIIG